MNCTSRVHDSGGQSCDTDKSPSWDDQISRNILRGPIDEGSHGSEYGNVLGDTVGENSCPSVSEAEDQLVTGSGDQPPSAQRPRFAMIHDGNADCRSGDRQYTPERIHLYLDSGAPGSSHASIMHSDDKNVTVGQKHICKVAVRDLEAGLYIDNMSYMDEEEKHDVDICKDENNPDHVEVTHEVVTVETCYHHVASCDVKAVIDSDLRKTSFVQTDDTMFLRDKEALLNGENKPGVDFLEKEAEVHGLRRRRGAKVDTIRSAVTGDFGLGRMPEEERRGSAIATRMKDVPVESGPEARQKPLDKKGGKQAKGTVKPDGRRVSDSQPLEDLRAKEDAETNRKVHESLDNFIRQTIRCEPYMTFSGRPGDKPSHRLRPDVFENHVGGKFGRGFKVEGGTDARDIGAEDNLSTDSHTSDIDGLKDTPISGSKGISGLGRGPQHSLKVPPGVVAFTQAAAKGTDLPGWPLLSPYKMILTKCDKCSREFCSSLNYRRHVRVHRKSLTEKDLSKERSKVAEFWDKLTREQASAIVNYENMEIEDLSGNLLLKALAGYLQQPGMPSMPTALMKAGSALLDIVQNKPSVYPLPSERLLSILDDASEKTFLSGGASGAYPRVVFNGDAGKVGLEDRNLVASMGFHVELRLVKAWMADKEAEALRNQQALFKEEEVAQQKRAKLLEKRRMKKIRQKERKVTASQLVQEVEKESLDDEGNIPGMEEDDSPTATGSSASSLVSAHDLVLPGTSDIDMNEEPGQVEGREGQVPGLAGEPILERKKAREEDNMQLPQDNCPPAGLEKSVYCSPEDFSESFVSVSRKGDYHSIDLTGEDKCSTWSPRNVDETAQDIDRDARKAQPLTYNRSGRSADVQSSLHSRKADQERITADFKRRESDRSVVERKSLRITRDRSRNEYSEPFQKPGRDTRGYDTIYVDGLSQPTFKPVRKANCFPLKSDSGTSDISGLSRSQQYRSKPPGMHRTLPIPGNGQVVWTRKVPQPAVVESSKDRKEDGIQDDKLPCKPLNSDGWEMKAELTDPVEFASDAAGAPDAGKPAKEDTEVNEVAATPAPVEVKPLNELKAAGSADDSAFVFGEKVFENHEEALYGGALLVGSLSVPIGKFATDRFVQSRNYPTFPFASEEYLVVNSSQAPDDEGNYLGLRSQPLSEAVDSTSAERLSLDIPESSEGPSESVGSDYTASVVGSSSAFDQGVKMKPQLPTSCPDRAESGRSVGLPPGHDRLAVKPGSWQTSAGRYVTAKVWRAVGPVGDRQDAVPGLAVAGGDGEGRNYQEDAMDLLARGEADRILVKKEEERQSPDDGSSVAVVSNMGEYNNDQALHTSVLNTARPADFEADVSLSGGDEWSRAPVNEDGADTAALVSGLYSLSVFLEVAGRFLSERWRVAIEQASPDDFVHCSAEGISKVGEGCISQQLFGQGMRHHSGADSLPCSSSSVVTQSLEKTAHDGGVFLSRIFNDSNQTGMEDVRHQMTPDDQRLDGAGSQECGMPQALSSEEDAGMRDSLSSPVDCEQFMSGTENFRSYIASAAPVGRVRGSERHPESRGGGGGSLGYSHTRHSNSRQERWFRNPRDRFPEQRYMPRRRAPVEKNC